VPPARVEQGLAYFRLRSADALLFLGFRAWAGFARRPGELFARGTFADQVHAVLLVMHGRDSRTS